MTSRQPFSVERSGPVLSLTLDTPGASVNVFGPEAALQLREVLVGLPAGIDLLVLRSAKKGSFVNGAGLLYAHAMRSRRDALQTSADVRAVYEQLASAGPLKVALIEGNCYGCGLELALCCDARLARQTDATEFRMTELTEYRFVPLFGGTWRLPRTVGLSGAGELLLRGAAWDASRALRSGLVDAVLPEDASEDDVQQWLRAAREGRGRRRPRPVGRLPAIEVPPTRAALWERCARLMEEGVVESPERSRQREVEAFADTVTAREAKRAMAFFFTKHVARVAALGSSRREAPPRPVRLPAIGPGRTVRAGTAEVSFAPSRRACEVSVPAAALEEGRELMRTLEWRGFDAVLTLGAGDFVSRRLIERSRREAESLVRMGVSPERINAALWNAGFDRPFRWRGWPTARQGGPDLAVVSRFALAWREVVEAALADRTLIHRSQGDVLVHLWLEFPLEEESLSRWLERHLSPAAAEAHA